MQKKSTKPCGKMWCNIFFNKDKEYMVDITVSDSQDIFKIKKAIED